MYILHLDHTNGHAHDTCENWFSNKKLSYVVGK